MLIDVSLWIVAAIWLAGALVRVYRQARYFQIEEYMGVRYLRWLFSLRPRWLPNRPTMALAAGALFSLLMTEASDGIFPAIIGIMAASVAAIPPSEGDIKKAFRPTTRAKRLLAVAFALIALVAIIGTIAAMSVRIESAPELRFVLVALVGYVVHLLAPVALVIANVLLMPVEGALRGRFVAQARKVLANVNPVVIGITGSYGKTSTKTYLTHILNGRYKAYATPKSYNTMMGVCIAINNDLANDYSVEYFVCEMGAYIPGEIARICDLTHPTISMVVEVGPQHLERFGSIEKVAIAKYEIIKALPPNGLAIFNWDNPYVRAMYERGYPTNHIAVSRELDPAQATGDAPRLIASEVSESLDGLRFRVTDRQNGESVLFNVPLLGLHNVTNILLATAVALHEGMTLAEVARRASTLQPAESRLTRQLDGRGITILNDAYSANPVSIGHALRVLSMHTSGRRLLITPGMVELGDLMEQQNQRLGKIAAHHATDVILIGEGQTAPIREGLREAGYPDAQVQVMASVREAIAWYERNLGAGDTVLFLNDLPDTYSS